MTTQKDGNTPLLSDDKMRELGFTQNTPNWYFNKRVGRMVSLNFTINPKTGDYTEIVLDEYFGQPEYYGNMKPEFRDEIIHNINTIIAELNSHGLTLNVNHDLYKF